MTGISRRGVLAGLTAAPLAGVLRGLPAATVTVWVPAALDKVRRERVQPGTPPAALRFSSAGNERHFGQLVVRTDAAATVTATASDLTGPGGATLPASAVAFFQQRYVNVTIRQNSKYTTGWWPDAVVPGNAVAAGPDGNAAFLVTVTVPAGQPAGAYSGSITLNGVTVPVELTVWGFAIPVAPTTTGAFAPWYQQAALAEGVRWGTPEFKARMDAYYDYQLDHRLVPNGPPLIGDPGPGPAYTPGPGPDPDPDAYIAQIAAYVRDPRVSSFQVPGYASGDQNSSIHIDTDKLGKVIAYLRQQGLLSKAYFYVGDEPGSDQAEDTLIGAYRTLHQVAPEVPTIMTLTHRPRQSLIDENNAWVFEQHTVPMLDEPRAVDTLKARGDLLWTYVCIGDTWPYPGVMIDDSLVGSRLLPWFQHSQGYTGLLYWSTTAFGSWDGQHYNPREVYAVPYSCNESAGDGFLLYPGKPAGVAGPVGSLRLHAVEAGMQDREHLFLFERRSMAIAQQLGVAGRVAVGDLLKPYFDVLYQWLERYQDDPALFDDIRTEVGVQVDRLVNGEPAVVIVGPAPRAYHVPVTVYVRSGVAVTIAGVASTPVERTAKADVHRTLLPLPAGYQKVVVTAGADTLTRSVQVAPIGLPHAVRINSFETDADAARYVDGGAVVARSTAHPATGKSSLRITFPAGVDWPGLYFRGEENVGRRDWSRFREVAFEAYNDSDQVLALNGKFYNPVEADDNHAVYLAPRQWQTVRFKLWHVPRNIYDPTQGNFDLSTLTSFQIYTGRRQTPVSLYIDDLRLESDSVVLENPGTSMRLEDDGVLTYALRKADGSIGFGWRDGDTWTQSVVPGSVAGAVATVLDLRGRLNVLGQDVWRRSTGTGWQSLAAPDVRLAGAPAAAIDATGRLTFLARTPENGLVVGWLDSPVSDSWHTALVPGAAALGDPGVGLDISGKLCFFVQTTGNQLLHGWQDTPGSALWHTAIIQQNGTGAAVPVAGRIGVGQAAPGRLCFVARDPSGKLSHGWQSAPGQGPWLWTTIEPVTDVDDDGNHVTSTVAGNPVCSLDSGGRLTYFVRTSDGRVLHGWQDHPDNGPWHATLIRTAGTYAHVSDDVAVSQDADGRLVFTGLASDGSVTTGWQDAPGTGPWHLSST
ncbi:glycoside hydrolase domain-containing protein [Fodinicola acaciae]|uniref:glycoside hydrolase domain-containing protein n=1 Tax=Fodinicola acaciae TaxID=2681555 RepID=UPI0013D65939|nr:glycoside hydrolase domain-containing protein [Fodinicola acaciae]